MRKQQIDKSNKQRRRNTQPIVRNAVGTSARRRLTIYARLRKLWHKASMDGRGITTSEFWVTLGGLVTTVGGFTFGILPKLAACICIAGMVITYTVARGVVKAVSKE